jgi:CDP-glucose 4,6-dehydratase
MFGGLYKRRRVLLTGHTGFKGSWLALWLKTLGADVTGLSLDPESFPNHWDLLDLDIDDQRIDIREYNKVLELVERVKPEVVFHLAAQPLVRRSYADPLTTWDTNVMGTANLLEACRKVGGVKAVLVVTSDKCYENQEWCWGYKEEDRLGGHDPYSASKAAAELLVSSYRRSYFDGEDSPLLASARAGNVIGGGDWCEDRLIPDLIRAVTDGVSLEIRSPAATRPWQHVLESLSGYLLLMQKLLQGEHAFADAWNFGPSESGNMRVDQVLDSMSSEWTDLRWHVKEPTGLHEAGLLKLDSSKARSKMNWKPVWGLTDTILHTSEWYRSYLQQDRVISSDQLNLYLKAAQDEDLCWVS